MIHELQRLLTLIQQESSGPLWLWGLGSGSARAVITAVASLKGRLPVNIGLIDRSKLAIEFSVKLAASNGLLTVNAYQDDVKNLAKYCSGERRPQIVEMAGLLDYLSDLTAIELLKEVYDALSGWLFHHL